MPFAGNKGTYPAHNLEPLSQPELEALNLAIYTAKSIRQVAEETGITSQRIKRLLARPDIQQMQAEYEEEAQLAARSLLLKAVERNSEDLDSDNPYIRQMAIDKTFKANGVYKMTIDNKGTSATDVAKAIVQAVDKLTAEDSDQGADSLDSLLIDKPDNQTFDGEIEEIESSQ